MVIDTNYNWSVYRKQETEMVSPKQNVHIRLSLPRLEDHSLQRKTQEDCESQTWSLKTTKQYPGYRTAVTYENPQMPKYQKKKTARKRKDGHKVIPLAKELFAMRTNGRGRISFL